jgi:RNA polymerase sigma-70 factor (ECF subfamily)
MPAGIAPEKKAKPAGNDEVLPLVERVRAGERQAFDQIVRLHERYVYRTCVAITGNAEDAEDAMQDTFIKAYRNLEGFRGESRFSTWLTRIAINEALQRVRRRRPTESLDAPLEQEDGAAPRQVEDWHPNPEQLYAGQQLRQLVEEAVLALPPVYRVVFLLRDVCEQSNTETAEALDLSVAAVKSRLLRARLMVRESLAEKLQLEPSLKRKFQRAGAMLAMMAQSLAAKLLGDAQKPAKERRP